MDGNDDDQILNKGLMVRSIWSEDKMSLSHWLNFIGECPRATGMDDQVAADESAVTCLPCLRRMAAGSHLPDGADCLDKYENGYLLGYCDGIEAAYARILMHLDDDAHVVECGCDQCRLVHRVLVSALRRMQQELGPDEWISVHRN